MLNNYEDNYEDNKILSYNWLNNAEDEEPIHDETINFHSLLCFIYTSGTTGMPKPACIKHFRLGKLKKNYFNITPRDEHNLADIRIKKSDMFLCQKREIN